MKTIVHISCDFPDPLVPAKTRSVSNLVTNTTGYRHVVYSMNRVSWRSGVVAVQFGDDRTALAYGAPPNGIFHVHRLRDTADWILRDLEQHGVSPDCIHAHKLSVEGIIGLELSHRLRKPFVCNIWGDSDLKVTKGRPDLAPLWRQILREAVVVMPCAPWATDRFEADLGLERAKSVVLPPIINHDKFTASAPSADPRLVSLFNLNAYKRKNFAGLVQAVKAVSSDVPGLTLDLYGVGAPLATMEVAGIIRTAGVERIVTMKGPLPEEGFDKFLGGYSAFVMPTLRETFGMVFMEAMFAGLPILHTQGWGVDGFFAPGYVGYAWNRQPDDLMQGLRYMLAEESRLKRNLVDLHATGGLDQFKTPQIVAQYRTILETATREHAC
jgi:glycosyltransferase involved in cell wall biosynthesis